MGRTCTQITIHGDLTIPQHKPDIERILRVTTTPIIDKTVTRCKQIIFRGYVRICVEYVTCPQEGIQPIYFVAFKIPFNGLLCHRFSRERLQACLKTKLLFQDFELIDPRNIKKLITLKLYVHKFTRVKKYTPLCSGDNIGGVNIVKPICPVEKPDCCKKIQTPVCKEKHHHHSSCKKESYSDGCKQLHPVCKADPPQYMEGLNQLSFSSQFYPSADNDQLNQYDGFYLPLSIQLVSTREPTTS